jgi:ketosteroid isomerase-like protein
MALAGANLIGSDDDMSDATATEKLMAVDREFSRLSAAEGRAAAFAAYTGDGATILRDNAHPFVGREAIAELMARSPQGTLTWDPHFADVSDSGALGYTSRHSEYRETDSSGRERRSLGYYVTIWKKQADGEWKVVFDTGSDGPSPEKW